MLPIRVLLLLHGHVTPLIMIMHEPATGMNDMHLITLVLIYEKYILILFYFRYKYTLFEYDQSYNGIFII